MKEIIVHVQSFRMRVSDDESESGIVAKAQDELKRRGGEVEYFEYEESGTALTEQHSCEILLHDVKWWMTGPDGEDFPTAELPTSDEEQIADCISSGIHQGELCSVVVGEAMDGGGYKEDVEYHGWWSIAK